MSEIKDNFTCLSFLVVITITPLLALEPYKVSSGCILQNRDTFDIRWIDLSHRVSRRHVAARQQRGRANGILSYRDPVYNYQWVPDACTILWISTSSNPTENKIGNCSSGLP